jgi:hypothetical protein
MTMGMNVFHYLQDNPENDEQEEDEKAEEGRGDEDETGLANVSWLPSDNEQTTDPFLHALTASMDAPASAPPPIFSAPFPFTFSAPSPFVPSAHSLFTLSASPLAHHKEEYSALMGLASISTTPSPSSMPVLSRKRSHISKPPAPALDSDMVALGGHIDSFTDAFCVATGTAPTNMEVSPLHKYCAIRSAQEVEVELTNQQLVALVNLFCSDIVVADTYMELKCKGLRKAWVMDQLESA